MADQKEAGGKRFPTSKTTELFYTPTDEQLRGLPNKKLIATVDAGVKNVALWSERVKPFFLELRRRFAQKPRNETIGGYRTWDEYCEKQLDRTRRAVNYFLAGGNPVEKRISVSVEKLPSKETNVAVELSRVRPKLTQQPAAAQSAIGVLKRVLEDPSEAYIHEAVQGELTRMENASPEKEPKAETATQFQRKPNLTEHPAWVAMQDAIKSRIDSEEFVMSASEIIAKDLVEKEPTNVAEFITLMVNFERHRENWLVGTISPLRSRKI